MSGYSARVAVFEIYFSHLSNVCPVQLSRLWVNCKRETWSSYMQTRWL